MVGNSMVQNFTKTPFTYPPPRDDYPSWPTYQDIIQDHGYSSLDENTC